MTDEKPLRNRLFLICCYVCFSFTAVNNGSLTYRLTEALSPVSDLLVTSAVPPQKKRVVLRWGGGGGGGGGGADDVTAGTVIEPSMRSIKTLKGRQIISIGWRYSSATL